MKMYLVYGALNQAEEELMKLVAGDLQNKGHVDRFYVSSCYSDIVDYLAKLKMRGTKNENVLILHSTMPCNKTKSRVNTNDLRREMEKQMRVIVFGSEEKKFQETEIHVRNILDHTTSEGLQRILHS